MPQNEFQRAMETVVQHSAPSRDRWADVSENVRQFREGYIKRAENFKTVIVNCLDEATDHQQMQAMYELLCETSKEFMRQRQAITNGYSCPSGYEPCPDGSCVPKGQSCESGELLNLLS